MADQPIRIMLADDFTGAMDAGMQLLGTYSDIPVILSIDKIPQISAPWMVLNTQSRNLTVQEALAVYNRLIPDMDTRGQIGYLKVDSTLRGNIGIMLEAFLSHGIRQILLAPALPAGNRKTVHGVHYVDGVPLSRHEISHDPFSSVHSDRVEDIIHAQTALPVSHLDLEQVRSASPEALAQTLRQMHSIVLADSETEEDLNKLAEVLRLAPHVLPSGSAGLISAMYGQARTVDAEHTTETPVLILRGSPAHIGRQQLENAQAELPDLKVFQVNPFSDTQEQIEKATQSVLDTLRRGGSVAVDAAAGSKTDPVFLNLEGAKLREQQAQIQHYLNRTALECCSAGLVHQLILMGGDSACGILEALDASWIRLYGAALPLIPAGVIMDGVARGVHVVTKAGGFGKVSAITQLLEATHDAQ